MCSDQNTFEHFELLEYINSGSAGEVFKALNNKTGQKVALKLFTNHYDSEIEFFKLDHNIQNIVTVHSFGTTNEQGYIGYMEMEYAKHGDLFDFLGM